MCVDVIGMGWESFALVVTRTHGVWTGFRGTEGIWTH